MFSFLYYINRPKSSPSFLFSYYEKKYTTSKELTDYIKKRNEESINLIVGRSNHFTYLLPSFVTEKYSSQLIPHFSLPSFYENKYLQNFLLYLGLFTGSFLFVFWRRNK
jgi:hypothetical protein